MWKPASWSWKSKGDRWPLEDVIEDKERVRLSEEIQGRRPGGRSPMLHTQQGDWSFSYTPKEKEERNLKLPKSKK